MSKFFITGITGQVGSQFADYLLAETEHEVVGMMRWQEPLDNLYQLTDRINQKDKIKIVYADLTDYTSLFRVISEEKPDYITHLAAQSYPKTSFDIPIETLETNIIGTANLLEAIRNLKKINGYNPIVHVCSSSEVYGRAAVGASLNEETAFHASSPYSISKIGTDYLGRYYGEAFGLRTFITRMGTHSGPRRSDVFFESTVAKQIALIEAGLQKPEIRVGNLESVRTYQDARDAIRAYYLLFKAMEEGKVKDGDYFNIAGQEAFKLNQIIDILVGMSKVKDISIVTDPDRLRPIDANYQMFDNTKIRSVINWTPKIPVREMLKDLLDHWRSEIARGKIPLNR